MMTMSKALTSGQAKSYYGSEYTAASESYYSESGGVFGEWSGELATELGLEGKVETEQFERLIDGQDPLSGEQVVNHVAAKEYTNEFGEKVVTSEHRAGWDATFSAPKTVSLAALVGGDERVVEAHREAVETALKELEKYTQARLGGNNPAEMTGKFIVAKFEHDAARPDKENGYAAPQLHTHAIIFNLTKTEEAGLKPVQPLELYRSQQYATAIYRSVLAEKLQSLGYGVEIDSRTGAPEIKGFSQEYIAANSPRREEVKREAAEMQERLEAQGIQVKEGAGLLQAAAKTNRAGKNYDRGEMQQRHRELDAQHGNQAQKIVGIARNANVIEINQEAMGKSASQAVTFARDHAMEREAVADMRKFTVDALRRGLGLLSFERVKQEIGLRHERGEFIEILKKGEALRMTTREMLASETSNISRALAGQGQAEPITADAKNVLEKTALTGQIKLNESQRSAVETILTSSDRIIGLQGFAGTGKTTTLSILKVAAETSGYTVKGFAPTSKAVKELGKSGIETITLQKFLHSRKQSTEAQAASISKRLYVLDESSLAATRNIERFFALVNPEDKILLVGDARQHQAIEAGSPFEQLQQHGMKTAQLTEIIRQKDADLKAVVEQLSAKEVKAAISQLESQGRIIEIKPLPDEVGDKAGQRRLEAIAADYVQNPEGALIVSPMNKERVFINQIVRKELQKEGKISETDHQTRILVIRQDMTGAERKFAASYVPGEDVVRYSTKSKVFGVEAGEYGRVTENNRIENTLTVQLESGRKITYNPERLSGVNVYKEANRQIATGDKIQFRHPFAEGNVANGEIGEVTRIEKEMFTVQLEGKREVTFNPKEFKHFDHGYAVTSFLSQGETVERVIVNADSRLPEALLNQRMAYVATSRARADVRIYTDSKTTLGEALDRQVDKQMAVEAIRSASEQKTTIAKNVAEQIREQRHWINVSHKEPCQVCQKPDGCTTTDDGALAWCRRVESEKQRGPGWLHIMSDREGFVPRDVSQRQEVPKFERAPIEHRDFVYRELLSRLELVERDQRDLKERGMSAERMQENGYRSTPARRKEADQIAHEMSQSGIDLRGVPGFYRDVSETIKPGDAAGPQLEWKLNLSYWHSGYLIPVKDEKGRIEGFQVRRENVGTRVNEVTGKEEKEAKYVWLSSGNTVEDPRLNGASSGSPIHYVGVEKIRESGHAIISEGALKGNLINHYFDQGVITVQGVGNFPDDFGQQLREKLPELKKVSIAFDADYKHNKAVELQLNRLENTLQQAGLEIERLNWNEQMGKGLDDYAKERLSQFFHRLTPELQPKYRAEVLRDIGFTKSGSIESPKQQKALKITEHSSHHQARERTKSEGISW